MKSSFVRALFLLSFITLIATAVFAETPKLYPYMTSLAADGINGPVPFTSPYSVAVDVNNNVYFAGTVPATNVVVYRIDYTTGAITQFAGGVVKATSPASTCATPDTNTSVIPAPWISDNVGDGCPALQTNFSGIRGLAVYNGYLYISDSSASAIKKIFIDPVNPAPGRAYANEMEPVVGGMGSVWNGDGLRATAMIKGPYGIAIDPANGNVYWGDGGSSGYAVRIYDVASDSVVTIVNYTPSNTVAPVAGCQKAPLLSVPQASTAKVTNPYGMDFDAGGNLYFVDKGCYSVRKLTKDTVTNKVDGNSAFSTLIGTGASGTGNGTSFYDTKATPGYMGALRSVASAGGDNLYITDTHNIWSYDASTGWVRQLTGTRYGPCPANPLAPPPYIGCPAYNVQFSGSSGGAEIATDSFGNIFAADFGNNTIQKISSGLDFVGTPNTIATAPLTNTVWIHGAGVTGATATGSFAMGTASCSVNTNGDLEPECVIPVTYTPTITGPEMGTLCAVGGSPACWNLNGMGQAPVPDNPPIATGVSGETAYQTPVTITLTATDADGDPLTYSVVAAPRSGTLGAITGNQVVYTPATGFCRRGLFHLQGQRRQGRQ